MHVKVVLTKVAKYPKYLNCWISYPLLISAVLRERRRYQIRLIFGKVPKGEGGIQSKSLNCRFFGPLHKALNRAFRKKIFESGEDGEIMMVVDL